MSSTQPSVTSAKGVALVSGSSRGIGRAIAIELARTHIVFVNGRTEAGVNEVVQAITTAGGRARPLIADLTQDREAKRAIDHVIAAEGQLDLLVCNLGSGKTPNVANPSIEEMRRVFDLNFFSAAALVNAALEQMTSGGDIIFISSIAGCEAIGAPIAYSAAKTALLGYAKTLSAQVAARGIRVNTVSPGNVLFEGSTWDDKIKKDAVGVRQSIEASVPLAKSPQVHNQGFAKPEDIAKAVSYLVSAPFITGHNLVVDGGQTHKMI